MRAVRDVNRNGDTDSKNRTGQDKIGSLSSAALVLQQTRQQIADERE